MLIVSGTLSVEPSDHDAMVALLAPLVEATLREEGNITYGFWAHVSEPGSFRVYEEWESTEAMNAHMGSEHMATFMGQMGTVAVTGTEIHQHEVAESSRLM